MSYQIRNIAAGGRLDLTAEGYETALKTFPACRRVTPILIQPDRAGTMMALWPMPEDKRTCRWFTEMA
ncbi:MAG TPA: hypothetical protein VLX29_11645 [Nitrospirota bacterium]|nr:hypothetical protein [Nitrospirota bacterium]